MTSYHMGIGNLTDVIDAYVEAEQVDDRQHAGPDRSPTATSPTRSSTSTAHPLDNEHAWKVPLRLRGRQRHLLLAGARRAARSCGSTGTTGRSSTSWRRLHGNKATSEEVFHPAGRHARLRRCRRAPGRPRLRRARADPRGRAATATGSARSSASSPTSSASTARSTVAAARGAGDADLHDAAACRRSPASTAASRRADRDQRRPRPALPGRARRPQREATPAYSLHTTGYSFDILRDYRNGKAGGAPSSSCSTG